jgi:hypothetical protein
MPYFEEGEPVQVGAYCALEGDLGVSVMGPLGFSTPGDASEALSALADDGNVWFGRLASFFCYGPF